MPLRLLMAHSPEERDAARRVEAQVFLQAFANTPELMEEEYGPYEARSRFVTVIDDQNGAALGVARLIAAGGSPVKTLLDVAGEPWRLPVADSLAAVGLAPGTVWDVASLAVELGCESAIDTDAHAPGQLDWQGNGCERAVECGVPIERVINTWTADTLREWVGRP